MTKIKEPRSLKLSKLNEQLKKVYEIYHSLDNTGTYFTVYFMEKEPGVIYIGYNNEYWKRGKNVKISNNIEYIREVQEKETCTKTKNSL